MVYFIADLKSGLCKIGFSGRPYRRLKSLEHEHSTSLTLLKTVKGTRDLEKKLHAKYHEHKVFGEWFKLNKIKECDYSTNTDLHNFKLGDYTFLKNSQGYFYIPVLQSNISKERLARGLSTVSYSDFKKRKTTKDLIKVLKEEEEDLNNNEFFAHPFLAYEMIRNYSLHIKIDLYKFLMNYQNSTI